LASARQVALQLLQRVQRDDSYVNLLLPTLLRQSSLDEADRGLVQELAYGALRWQLQYDSFIDILAGGKAIEPDIRLILRLGMHQLLRMRIPSHAAINESVEQVKFAMLIEGDTTSFSKMQPRENHTSNTYRLFIRTRSGLSVCYLMP